MKRAILFSVLAAGCAAEPTSSTSQAATTCADLPPMLELAEWRGEPLYPVGATRVATLAYRADAAGHEFIAYGVDVDAGAIAFVMHGDWDRLDLFLHDVSADVVSPIAFKGGDGAGPRPPGDPPDPEYVIAAASAAFDQFSNPDTCAP